MPESLAELDIEAMTALGKLAVGIATDVGGTPEQSAAVVNSVMLLIGGEYIRNRETYQVEPDPIPPGVTLRKRAL